jgi:hypothetical protein
MTAKRDLKRRVRERQAKTGEAYTTARRNVVGAVAKPDQIAVDELIDLTAEAAALGLSCKILMSQALATTVDPVRVLRSLRDALLATLRDRETELLRGIALDGKVSSPPLRWSPDRRDEQFIARVRSGLGGVSADGRTLGLHVAGVPMLCSAWRSEPTLLVSPIDDAVVVVLSRVGARIARPPAVVPALYVVLAGERHRVTKPMFVIGRSPAADLVIRDARISRKHAAVVHNSKAWFIKDLESENGIEYKGMRISNKRIDEGDVFELDGHALHFTFRVA